MKHFLFHVLLTPAILLSACGSGTSPHPAGVENEPYPLAASAQASPAAGYPEAATPQAPTATSVPTQTAVRTSFTGTPMPIPTRTAVVTSLPSPTPDAVGTPGFELEDPGIVYQAADLTLAKFDGSQVNVFAAVPRLQPWNSDFSPEAGRIVYYADNSLWILELGRTSQRILSGQPFIESPIISSDGARIAYSLVSGPPAEDVQLWTVNADGSENTLVDGDTGQYITDPGPFRLVPAAWSLDHSKLYMTTTTDSEATPVGLYVADVAAGTFEKALTPQVTLWDLSFSPDRSRIAYHTFQWIPVQDSMPEVGPPFTLQVTDLATGATTVLQESDSFEYAHLVWSQDGEHIAYSVRSRQLGGEIGLFTLDLATRSAVRLVPGSEGKQLRPWAWLSDDRLAYSEENEYSGTGFDPLASLYTIKIDGSDKHEIESADSILVLGVLDE